MKNSGAFIDRLEELLNEKLEEDCNNIDLINKTKEEFDNQ